MIGLFPYYSDVYDLFNIPRPPPYKDILDNCWPSTICEIEDRMWCAEINRLFVEFLGPLGVSSTLDLFNGQPNIHQQWIGYSYERG